jgi:hypothetical protein
MSTGCRGARLLDMFTPPGHHRTPAFDDDDVKAAQMTISVIRVNPSQVIIADNPIAVLRAKYSRALCENALLTW